jgi:hypothetical protein
VYCITLAIKLLPTGNAAELEGRKPTGNSNRQGSALFRDEETVPLLGTRRQ